MFNLLSFVETHQIVSGIEIALAAIVLICAAFIIFVVMRQSGNTDGMEAMTGSSKQDDSETYYGKNAGSRREARLKLMTYIIAGVLAACCIALLIMGIVI